MWELPLSNGISALHYFLVDVGFQEQLGILYTSIIGWT